MIRIPHIVRSLFLAPSAVAGLWLAAATPAKADAVPPGAILPAAAMAAQAEGRAHPGPRAYHAMCARAPRLCMADRQASRVARPGPARRLTPALWAELGRVNATLNARIAPEQDLTLYGTSDYWTLARDLGDCEDYMIAKKQALMARGWAADQLLYAVVEGTVTPYHAVLIVRTDRGEFVLDNMTDRVVPWDASGYRFVVRQSAARPHRWVEVLDPAPRLVGGQTNGPKIVTR